MYSSKTQNTLYSASFWRRITLWLLHFLCLTVPLFFLLNTEELFEFNKLMLSYALILLIAVSFFLSVVFGKKKPVLHTLLSIPLGIFIVSQVLSTIFSIHPFTSFFGYYTRFNEGLLSTFAYAVLFYAALGTLTARDVKRLLYSLLISGSIVSVYAILEHFGHSVSCLLVSGGTSFGVDCWIQDVQSRVFATFGQPNWLAAFLSMLIPVSLVLSMTAKSWYAKHSLTAASLLFVVALVFTQSRSGILAVFISLLVLGASLLYWLIRKKITIQKLAPVLVTTLIFAGLAAWYNTPLRQLLTAEKSAPVVAPQQTVDRLEAGGTDSGDIRKIVWSGALKVWQRYPLFGSGVETFAYSYYLDRPVEHNLVSEWDFLYNKAHNEFLNYLATTGIVGLLSYCLFLGACALLFFKLAFLSDAIENESKLLGAAFLASLVAISVSNFFGFSTVVVSILVFLYPACAVALERRTDSYEDNQNVSESTALVVLSVAGIIAVAGLLTLMRYWTADMEFSRGKQLLAAGQSKAGLHALETAVARNPGEALFIDTLGSEYANIAVELARVGQATAAAQLASRSVAAIKQTFALNPRQLNYYKTSARSLILLSQFDDLYLTAAQEVLTSARELAPTDAKVVYNLGLIEIDLQHDADGTALLEEAVRLKPNYDAARAQLAAEYEKQGKLEAALEQLEYIVKYSNPNATDILQKIAELNKEIAKQHENNYRTK